VRRGPVRANRREIVPAYGKAARPAGGHHRMRAVGIICARNEELHIAQCLDNLLKGGCEAIVIDNESEDSTVEIARRYLGRGLLSIERLPWRGFFSLRDQLLFKKRLMRSLTHDWVMHVDADEWLCAPWPGLSLSDAIERVDGEGFNCINFIETVFVPWPEQDFANTDYLRHMKTYYFFAPRHPRRMIAWRREIDADNVEGAGHLVAGADIRLYPTDFWLRHYIALSVAHACKKYVHRKFNPDEIAQGWHVNRTNIEPNQLLLKPSHYLRKLDVWDAADFDRSSPAAKHFWEWHA
jgi:glycosyltransferase involved in cell wall biosynthesis